MAKPSAPTLCITLFLYFILLLLSTTIPSSQSNNHTDLEALLAFKKSIHDDPLQNLRSWNETTHFCSWNGVSCSKRHPNRVVSLSLRSQGLMGSLSPHIGNLSFLRTIILQNNTFCGPIPQEIGQLRRLKKIEFSNNSFGGGIPTNLSHCTNLYYLNLIDNELTGAIIPEIGSMVNLQHLGLGSNMLSRTIPPFIGNLTKLIQFSLTDCGLQGEVPESLGQLRRIQSLNLHTNNLTGSVPSTLYNLSSIQILDLGSNQLHGTLPSFIFPKLSFLSLSSNHFTGPFPSSLSNSSMIKKLQLGSNNFTGNMIDLTRLPFLEILAVSYNHLEGDIETIVSSLGNSTRLRALDLGYNLFTGSLPDSIGNLSGDLFFMFLSQNQFSGSIPSSIGNLVGLTSLMLENNNLQGPIPSSIGKLHKLQAIYLEQNMLTNEIPLSFGNLTFLNDLVLWGNNLSGSIPQSLANCTSLQTLYLSENSLNGSIPPGIMGLSSLSIGLDLSHNMLTGTIPAEVGGLRNLEIMELSNNGLTGIIPTSLTSCVMLGWLGLGSNSLHGQIPAGLTALKGLEHMDLSCNNISGTIPRFLADFQLILYLNLSFNALQGEVPTVGVFGNASAVSLQGNDHLCGGIAILNLPSCSSPNSDKRGLGKILIPTATGVVCLVLLACFGLIMCRRRTLQRVGTPVAVFEGPEFLRLSYADLLTATGGFLESNLLGAGRFGSVYRGTIINDGGNEESVVAVKVLDLNIKGAYKSLASECNALRGIRHRNLLKIVSVCDSVDNQGNDFKALVYEFMVNGSLENWLHRSFIERGTIFLSAIQRLNIALDIASAVEYLHCGTNSTVIHGDLKPSNILLDQDMVAHVGDFGLAKIVSSISLNLSLAEGSSSIAIKGTIGYIAPEYGMNDVVSTQGDAYSYGILLLEMFTNKRPTSDDEFEGHVNLQDFVSNALPNRVMEVVDPLLFQELDEGDKYWDCIVSILRIGVRCSNELPSDRMSMPQVVNEFKKIRDVFLVNTRGARRR